MRNFLYLAVLTVLFSCRSLAPNRILVTREDFPVLADSLNSTGPYVLSPFDKLDLNIYSNDGFKLVDITNPNYVVGKEKVEYVLNENGDVKLPVIGYVNLRGLTVEQSERLLETKYERYFNQPYINLKVLNRTAVVFMGDGKAQLVPLEHENTTLFEVLAAAGGITDLAKAYRIKIIRGDAKNPTIYHADVSTVDGVHDGNIKIMSNDIIHVEAIPNYSGRIYQRLFPIIGLITTTLLVLNLLK